MKMTIRENAIPFAIKAKRLTNKDIDNAFKYLDSFKVCDKEKAEEIIEILNDLSEEDKKISSSHVVEL
ncbi:antitoxin [Fusobacterium nucleatum YWH7055]|nr:antitoxin [Fusobacterium nucleatum YWH7055]